MKNLFHMKNVATRRTDRINSDEEERLRLGYEIRTGIKFSERGGKLSCRTAKILVDDTQLATLTYGHTATIWRMNLGWRRRKNKNELGFHLDVERGYWAKNPEDTEDEKEDPLSKRIQRVVPYVEDRKNSLLFEPSQSLSPAMMASLGAAFKNAIQVLYQLEEMELAVEPLPDRDNRNLILFYESAEGGAGVLRQLIDDPKALSAIAKRALDLCHFDPENGNDFKRAYGASEDCEAACYDCLMSYGNQMDHKDLDRHEVKPYLQKLMTACVEPSPVPIPRPMHLKMLKNKSQSTLETKFLDFLENHNLHLPSDAQVVVSCCKTRPDFIYTESAVAIYVDGPPHDYPDRQARDQVQTDCMEDNGYLIIRFGHKDNWEKIVEEHPNIFGSIGRPA